MGEIDFERDTTAVDHRLRYETPELVDCGDVAGLTQLGAINPGADGLYS